MSDYFDVELFLIFISKAFMMNIAHKFIVIPPILLSNVDKPLAFCSAFLTPPIEYLNGNVHTYKTMSKFQNVKKNLAKITYLHRYVDIVHEPQLNQLGNRTALCRKVCGKFPALDS